MSMLDKYQICQQTREWHDLHHPHHAFIEDGDDVRLGRAETPSAIPVNRGDPVLRLALIKAGVISEKDLTEAEVWLREASSSGKAVVVEEGEFKLISIEEWIKALAG